MEKELNYKLDVEIDHNALDVEMLRQGQLAVDYGEYWANCRHEVAKAQENVKIVRSDLIMRANKYPVKCCKKEKPNAGDIEAYYRSHPKHKKAKEELIEAEHNLDIAEIAKSEICYTRKSRMDGLIKLHGQGYFAGPRVPRNLDKEMKTFKPKFKKKPSIRKRKK